MSLPALQAKSAISRYFPCHSTILNKKTTFSNRIITSYGIIALRRNQSSQQPDDLIRRNGPILPHVDPVHCVECSKVYKNCEYVHKSIPAKDTFSVLLQERKNTHAYTDIVRGQYKIFDEYTLKALVHELTCVEAHRLLSWSFDQLWSSLWVYHSKRRSFKSAECIKSKAIFQEKYPQIRSTILECINKNLRPHYPFNEFGFPKGRREKGEDGLQCAVREFCEETGYKSGDLQILDPSYTVKEEFIGSDRQCYRHIYYIAFVNCDNEPTINRFDIKQAGEINNMGWYSFDQAFKMLESRPYDVTKSPALKKALDRLQMQPLIDTCSL